jgi:hypothetical protein
MTLFRNPGPWIAPLSAETPGDPAELPTEEPPRAFCGWGHTSITGGGVLWLWRTLERWVRLGDIVFNIWYFKQGCHVLFEEAVEGYCEIEVKVLELKFSQKFLDKSYDIVNGNGDMVELLRPSLPILGHVTGAGQQVDDSAEVVVPKGSKKRVLTQKDSWAELFKIMGAQAMMDSNDLLKDGKDGDGDAADGAKKTKASSKTPKHILT